MGEIKRRSPKKQETSKDISIKSSFCETGVRQKMCSLKIGCVNKEFNLKERKIKRNLNEKGVFLEKCRIKRKSNQNGVCWMDSLLKNTIHQKYVKSKICILKSGSN